jgi:hypothetical protein
MVVSSEGARWAQDGSVHRSVNARHFPYDSVLQHRDRQGAQFEEYIQMFDNSLALAVDRDHMVAIIQQHDLLLNRGDFVIDELAFRGPVISSSIACRISVGTHTFSTPFLTRFMSRSISVKVRSGKSGYPFDTADNRSAPFSTGSLLYPSHHKPTHS